MQSNWHWLKWHHLKQFIRLCTASSRAAKVSIRLVSVEFLLINHFQLSVKVSDIYIQSPPVFSTGCPVVPDHKQPMHWDYNNRTLKEVSGPAQTQGHAPGQGLQYRMLVGGRVLEVNTLQGKFSGRYRCQTLINNTRQMLSAWISVHTEGEHEVDLHACMECIYEHINLCRY